MALTPPQQIVLEHVGPQARGALILAEKRRVQHGYAMMGTQHILLGLLDLPQSKAASALRKEGVNLVSLREQLIRELARQQCIS